MNIEEICEYCITKPGVTEGFPFNDTVLVFKVAGKMFALLDLSEDSRGISLKCDPELARSLQPFFLKLFRNEYFDHALACDSEMFRYFI